MIARKKDVGEVCRTIKVQGNKIGMIFSRKDIIICICHIGWQIKVQKLQGRIDKNLKIKMYKGTFTLLIIRTEL